MHNQFLRFTIYNPSHAHTLFFQCGKCGAGFCVLCFKDCGRDAHTHTMGRRMVGTSSTSRASRKKRRRVMRALVKEVFHS